MVVQTPRKAFALAQSDRYAAMMRALGPVQWLRFRETSGLVAADSAGSGLDATIAGTTSLGQPGVRGGNEAYAFDGATSQLTVSTPTAINSLAQWTYMLVARANSAGEGSAGRLWDWDPTVHLAYINLNDVLVILPHSTTNGVWRFLNMVPAYPTPWFVLFATWNSTALGGGMARVGDSGLTAPSLQTSPVGTYAAPTGSLYLGNRSTALRTWDGLLDEWAVFDRVLTGAEMLRLARLKGVLA
jgi:hypothetical protein